MGSVPVEATILSAVRPMIAAGVAVHWLHRREKMPVGEDWQTAPVHTYDSLRSAYRNGYNIGIRPGEPSKTPAGFLHLIDLDIRDANQAEAAWARLVELWPAARQAPFVVSGSGGESKHLYFFTDRPFRSLKLAHSAGFSMVFDAKKGRDVKKNDWEIELFGSPKQAVLPPSLHPDTGEPYYWGREIDWGMVELGIGPSIPADIVAAWGVRHDDLTLDDDDDLMKIVRSAPMGLSEREITATLNDLPPEWIDDRDQWLQVGAALHHEFEGTAAGFERWCEWSKTSEKYDAKDQSRVWKSFKGARQPVRMATLIKAAGETRLSRDHGDLVVIAAPVNDLADLFGPAQPIAPGASVVDPNWKSYLQMSEDGLSIKPTLHNVELIIRNDPRTRGVAAYNEFVQEVVQIGKPAAFALKKAGPKPVRQLDSRIWDLRDPINGDLWSDSQDNDVRLILEAPTRQGGYGLKTSERDLRGAIDKVAHLNSFHPVRNYLTGLRWDGVNRVATLFIDYLGTEDNAYHREASLLWMLGAVTRVFEPGHKFDFVPILEGLQGKRKSTFAAILARYWFAELEGDFHDTKGMVEKMQGAWILEIPELQGFSKADVTIIKGFVSRRFDKVRMAYARRATEFHRQCVFMGSTNDHEYLRDSTGGRRFWPVACNVNEIDTDRLQTNVDQLWAEAMVLFHEWRTQHPGGTLPLYMKNPIAADEAKLLQESRRQQSSDDVLAARIEQWLEAPIGEDLGFDPVDGDDVQYRNETCLAEIWDEMMGHDINKQSDRELQMLGRAIRKVPGWMVDGQARFKKYGKQRRFRRIDAR